MNSRARSMLFSLLALVACADEPVTVTVTVEPGWKSRIDEDSAGQQPRLHFRASEGGFLSESGPNAIFYDPKNVARGRYSLSVGVHLLDSFGHAHGAGLLFGGEKLSEPGQAYSYFLVRGDGQDSIKVRDGAKTNAVVPWTAHKAIRAEDDKGVAKNAIRIEVGETNTKFIVNDVEIKSLPNAQLRTQGIHGFRQVHDLKVLFANPHLEVAGQ